MGLVELGEIDPGFRRFLNRDSLLEFGFGAAQVVVRIRHAREHSVGGAGESWHHAGRERVGLVIASADDERSGDIVFAKVIERGDAGGVEFDGAGEAALDFPGKRKSCDGAGMARLHSVGASKPEVGVACLLVVGGGGGHGELALMDGFIGGILGIKYSAQELMRDRVRGIGGEVCAKQSCSVLDAAFLQRMIGGCVPCQSAVYGCDVRHGLLCANLASEDCARYYESQNEDREGEQGGSGGTGPARLERRHGGGIWGH